MRIVTATEAQKVERDALCHDAWGKGLDRVTFVARERRFRAHPWSRGAMTTWLLVDDAGGVLASCETFAMRSLLRGHEGRTYGVASVYTEPALRGRGHALAMMRLLAGELPRRDPGAHGSILFSEVGPKLYEAAGWTALPSFDRVVAADASLPAGIDWIEQGGLEGAAERLPPPADRFSVWPTAAQLDWHLERERFYAEALRRARPSAIGAATDDATALWAADFKNEQLVVLLASAPDAEHGARLVAAARRAAWEAGLRQVRIWEEPGFPLPVELGRRLPREDLPMLLPFAPGLEPGALRRIPRALWM